MGEPGAGEVNKEIILGPPIEPPNTFGEYDVPDVQEQAIAAERIKNRDAMDIRNNFERSMRGINDFYVEKQIQLLPKRSKLIPRLLLEKYFSHKLERLAQSFGEDFDSAVFSNIVHGSASDLGEEADLKSPALLAEESKVPFDEVPGKHSGGIDIEIGNTDYVFGASMNLRGRAWGSVGPNASDTYKAYYRIESEDGYVVPVDITVMKPHKPNQGQMNLSTYADNIFTLRDFKKLLPTYCAALFESSEMAVKFLARAQMLDNDFWFKIDDPNFTGMPIGDTEDSDIVTLQNMRQILADANVYPPFGPEFQFKDRVRAVRIEQYKADVKA